MAAVAPTLGAGVIVGLLLALLLQRLELPVTDGGSTHASSILLPAVNFTTILAPTLIAAMLRNSLQIAARSFPLRAYKKATLPAAASLLPTTTPALSPTHHLPPTTTSLSSFAQSFSTTTSTMASKKSFLDAVKDRRTIYALNKESPISDKEIVEIVKQAVLHVPSSFNSQSARLVVLLKEEHNKFWDATLEILKTMVPADQLPHTEGRIAGFKGGYGTILFWEDPAPVRALQESFPLYAHHFPDWSEHTSAMHQYALWVALEAEGFGANLQHYNPIVDRKAQETWNVPLDWKLRAQLVFGGKAGEPGEKEFKPIEERLFVHGGDV